MNFISWLVTVRDGAARAGDVAPFFDVCRRGKEIVVGIAEFACEQVVKLTGESGGVGVVDQIGHLQRIGLVVEQEPGAVEIADVSIARGPEAAVFFAAVAPFPFAEGSRAGNKGGRVGRVRCIGRGLFTGEEQPGVVSPFNRVGDFLVTEREQRGHEVFGTEDGIELAWLQFRRPAHQQGDADGFVIGLLFASKAV